MPLWRCQDGVQPVEDHLVQPGHHPFLAVLTAPFRRGEKVVGLLAAQSLVEPGRVAGVILAVEDQRGTGDQRGVAFEGVGGEGAEGSRGAVFSEDPHTPWEGRAEGIGSGAHDLLDEGVCLRIACDQARRRRAP